MSQSCPRCGAINAVNAAICGACTARLTSASTALVPVPKRGALPVLSQGQKATLGSVALGVAALALRIGVSVLQRQDDAAATSSLAPSRRSAKSPAAPTSNEQWTVRRRWVIGDRDGVQRWGEEEVEVQPSDSQRGTSLRLNLRPPS
ncbi:MAG: hypothetical protein KDD73_01005 [Anaerolineales bacterium]|nr:hypothetical protein [Anaerolineales bacterium]MCB9129129.1 hypothetical protein [Ardenticatenales bacterium]